MPRLTVSIDINVAIDVEAVSVAFGFSLTQHKGFREWARGMCDAHLLPILFFVTLIWDHVLIKKEETKDKQWLGKRFLKNGFSGSIVSDFTSYRWRTRPCYHLWSRALLDRHTGLFKSFYRPLSGVWKNLNALIGKKGMQRGPQFGRFEFHFINGKEPLRGTWFSRVCTDDLCFFWQSKIKIDRIH